MICPRCGQNHEPAKKQPVTVAVCDDCYARDVHPIVATTPPKPRRKPRPKKEK